MAKILVADDDHLILDSILDVLESVGHEVVCVADGLQALALLEHNNFDVAVIDVMMPKMDGYHLAIRIHSLSLPPKIIVISSRRFEEDKSILRSIGAAAFISKPFSNKELLETIHRLVK